MLKSRSFRTEADFRAWLERNHASEKELMMRLFKVHAAEKGIGYKEALDEALCFGWIDGVRRRVDETRYTIRFTPRRKTSIWSAINIGRVAELRKQGRMQAAGLAAFAARDEKKSAIYAYENRPKALAPEYEKVLKRDKAAWEFFQKQPPSYRKLCAFWIMSAKQEETRQKRLARLVADSAAGKRI